MPRHMTLINGPYHGRIIDDIGTVVQKMPIYRKRKLNEVTCGYAFYEPSEDRLFSFWRENVWDGSVLVEQESIL